MHHSIIALQTGAGGADVAPMIAGSGGLDPTRTFIILAIAVVAIAVLYPIARAIAKRLESRGTSPAIPATNADSDARLQRLEQSV